MSRIVSRTEADRLGKRGSYRLGGLSQQGIGQPGPPRAFRPSFTRAHHAGPTVVWVLGAVAAIVVIARAAAAGWWFLPFAVGLVTGLAMRWGGWRLRVSGPATVVMSAAGWGLALWIPALDGLPVGATARTIAALAGWPASAALAVTLTLAISVAQGLAGLWLGRALTPRPVRS
jgi:hypothetical protein